MIMFFTVIFIRAYNFIYIVYLPIYKYLCKKKFIITMNIQVYFSNYYLKIIISTRYVNNIKLLVSEIFFYK